MKQHTWKEVVFELAMNKIVKQRLDEETDILIHGLKYCEEIDYDFSITNNAPELHQYNNESPQVIIDYKE